MNNPKTTKIVPVKNTRRKYPASVRRPVKVPMKKRRKICMVPIQEIVEGWALREVA
jgi:hypothetical protein